MPHPVVTCSAHAQTRMRQRSNSEQLVSITLSHADRIYLGKDDNLIAEKRLSGGQVVRVVYVDRLGSQGYQRHVVTVMWK